MTTTTTTSSSGAYPAFALDRSLYDMGSYWGRVRYFYASIHPRMLFVPPQSLLEAKATLDEHRRTGGQSSKTRQLSDDALWEARAKVESCIHPVTGDIIPAPFRMAAFVPVNFLIVPAMLLPSTIASVPRTIGIHWLNQSFNALVNYANRGSDAQPISAIATAYTAAVSISVAGALGATMALRRLGSGPAAAAVRATLPMLAVAGSGAANVGLMRRNEWAGDGVAISDEDGRVVGKSTAAGRISWAECSVARLLWNIPTMTLPPLLSGPLAALVGRPMAVEIALIYAGLIIGVPPALAFYPPIEKVSVNQLEAPFQQLKRANDEPVKIVSFAKGL